MPCLVWRHTKTYPGKAQPCQVPAGCPRECRARYRHCAQLGGWTIVALSLGASASTVSICPQLMHLKMHRSGSGPPFAALPENFISRPPWTWQRFELDHPCKKCDVRYRGRALGAPRSITLPSTSHV
jgi:hypothetical protein